MYACVVVNLLSQLIVINTFIARLKSVQKRKFLQGFNSFTKRKKKPTCMTRIFTGMGTAKGRFKSNQYFN